MELPGRTPTCLLVVVGTRPEVIKLAPLVEALRASRSCSVTLCAVTQHTNLLREALRDWQLVPDVEIHVTRQQDGLSAILAEMLPALAQVIRRSQPAAMIVQGDTITSMGAALAAGYERVPIAHVEAGLRTGDLMQPFPEEFQRVVIDRVSAIRYAPTEQTRANLLAEGCDHDTVVVVGNTVIDALRLILTRPHTSDIWGPDTLPGDSGVRRVLVTAHRRENFGDGMASICDAVIHLTESRPDVEVVYVLHPNPNARNPALSALSPPDPAATSRAGNPCSHRTSSRGCSPITSSQRTAACGVGGTRTAPATAIRKSRASC